MKIFRKFFFGKTVGISKTETVPQHVASDFETAITASGFGKFNFLLILTILPMSWSTIFETTTMSYVFPAAQCDLNLSLEDKGMLNAITYAGTLMSGLLWGFLVDTMGRRKLIIIGFFLDALFVILSGFSQNLSFLMAMKFMGGFISNGPFIAVTSYISEVHSMKNRSKIQIVMGLFTALGNIYLPLLASFILPIKLKLYITDSLVLHSWGFYLLLCALPSLISGIIFIFLPESPKFLMSNDENDKALKVFQQIYSINSGMPKETYPIQVLVKEVKEKKVENGSSSKFRDGWNQVRPLFCRPLLKILILVCSLQMFIILGQNTLRLWLPQLFQAITDYKFLNNGTSSSLCEMLNIIQPSNDDPKECFVNSDNLEVYVNSMIVSGTSAFTYLVAGTLVNLLGENKLLTILSFLAGIFAGGIYLSPNGPTATLLISIYSSLASLGSNVVLMVVVNLFPTTLRTLTISLVMMFGRGAAMVGNILFPFLLEMGCSPPFLFIAAALIACGFVSLLLPKKNMNFI